MLYKISNVVIKSNDWKVVSVKGLDGTEAVEVSVNRADKSGVSFPNYDAIIDGGEVEGNLWASPNGKKYLFAPKPASTGNSKGSGAISKAQDKKAEQIEASQDRKDYAIRLSMSMELAKDIAVAEGKPTLENIFAIRKTLWENWEKPTDGIPF